MECFTKDLAAWGARRQVGHSPYLSLAHNPTVFPLPEIHSTEKMQQLPICPAFLMGGRKTLFPSWSYLILPWAIPCLTIKLSVQRRSDQDATKIMSRKSSGEMILTCASTSPWVEPKPEEGGGAWEIVYLGWGGPHQNQITPCNHNRVLPGNCLPIWMVCLLSAVA